MLLFTPNHQVRGLINTIKLWCQEAAFCQIQLLMEFPSLTSNVRFWKYVTKQTNKQTRERYMDKCDRLGYVIYFGSLLPFILGLITVSHSFCSWIRRFRRSSGSDICGLTYLHGNSLHPFWKKAKGNPKILLKLTCMYHFSWTSSGAHEGTEYKIWEWSMVLLS